MPNVDAGPDPDQGDRVDLSVADGVGRLRLVRSPTTGSTWP